MNLRSFGDTDPGPVRAINEDRFLADDRVGLYAVVDGTSGWVDELIGGVAATTAIDALREGMRRAPRLGDDSPGGRLKEAIALVGDRIREVSRSRQLGGVSVAIAAVAIDGERAFVAHVGHARVYLWREHRLEPLTTDHTLGNEARKAPTPAEEAALSRSPLRDVLTRAVGSSGMQEEPDTKLVRLADGDRLLLCSDGLWKSIWREEIADALEESPTPEAATITLLRRGAAGHAHDNVTVVVVDVGR